MDSENNNVEKQELQKNTPLIPQEPTNENQTTPANDAHVEQPPTTAEIATQHKVRYVKLVFVVVVRRYLIFTQGGTRTNEYANCKPR